MTGVKTTNYLLKIDYPHLEKESQEGTQLIKAGSELHIQICTNVQ